MRSRVDKSASKTTRMFDLFFKIYNAKRWIPISELDGERWGDPRTIRRTIAELNRIWQKHYQRSLFEIVDADGNPALKGERFIKITDSRFDAAKAEKIAIFPAVVEFLATMKGTILEDQLQPFYKALKSQIPKSQRALLRRNEKKFIFVGKGVKSYADGVRTDVLDHVYDALLKEVMLEVTVAKNEGHEVRILKPLALAMFNSGLYLLAHNDGQNEHDEPRRYRLEGFVAA